MMIQHKRYMAKPGTPPGMQATRNPKRNQVGLIAEEFTQAAAHACQHPAGG